MIKSSWLYSQQVMRLNETWWVFAKNILLNQLLKLGFTEKLLNECLQNHLKARKAEYEVFARQSRAYCKNKVDAILRKS